LVTLSLPLSPAVRRFVIVDWQRVALGFAICAIGLVLVGTARKRIPFAPCLVGSAVILTSSSD